MMEKYILAIDQGTTSSRAILFDQQRNIKEIAQKEFPQIYPQAGWVEQDANDIWLSVLAVVADCIQKAKIEPSQIAAIGISNQRETTILWDKKTGMPVYSAIVWQSRQSEKICDELKAKGYESLINKKCGLRIDPYFSATKIKWILDHVDGVKERANRGEILFGTVDSWIVWKLSNGVHISDVSNASRTMLYNIHEDKWDEELLDIMEIPASLLPKIMPTSCVYAKTSPYLFFNEKIPIASVVGDQQAALFGQGCFEQGSVKNTYGTGGFLLMNTGTQIIPSKHGLLTTVAWKIDGQIEYALEGSIFVSGSLIKWLRDQMHLIVSANESEECAKRVPDTNGVYIIPAFVGMGAPYWDEKCRGAIFGLTLGVNKDHIVRAALESIAYQSKDVLNAMQEDSGVKIPYLRVDGGASANAFLLQFQSDLLQVPVERLSTTEITALGAATLAGLAIGFYRKEDLKVKKGNVIYPQMSKEKANTLYTQWKKAVSACCKY